MKTILVINGPNLNMLGKREPGIYGTKTLAEIEKGLAKNAEDLGLAVVFVQSNHEGEIIDRIQQAQDKFDGILINPGAYTHYSYAIRDAIAASALPTVEVHLSNVFGREEFRSISVTAPSCVGIVAGLGQLSYLAGLFCLKHILEAE